MRFFLSSPLLDREFARAARRDKGACRVDRRPGAQVIAPAGETYILAAIPAGAAAVKRMTDDMTDRRALPRPFRIPAPL